MRGMDMDVIFPMPLDFFGSSGLDTKASQSQAFLKKGQLLLSGGKGDKKAKKLRAYKINSPKVENAEN